MVSGLWKKNLLKLAVAKKSVVGSFWLKKIKKMFEEMVTRDWVTQIDYISY